MLTKLKILVAIPGAAALTLVSAYAAESIYVYSRAALLSPTQAYVGARVSCSPDELQPSLSITLQQPSGSGSGSISPTCDNRAHYYAIPVTATNGTFAPGPADAQVNYSYVTCTTSPNGPPDCVGNESVDFMTVRLYQVRPPH